MNMPHGKSMKSLVVIGAGPVGCNAAIFLSRLGFQVTLLERGSDILQGSAQASFINHGDGFEYYKPNHQRTGETCIEGSLVKALVYPLGALSTGVCDGSNPIRFFVSRQATRNRLISKEGFLRNAMYMMKHYEFMYGKLQKACGMTDARAAEVFVRPPEFMRKLSHEECADVEGVVAGVSGNGFGINMPHYYAFVKAALREARVECHFNVTIDRIAACKTQGYQIHTRERQFPADQVLVCAAHHIPEIAGLIEHGAGSQSIPGTYYLNSMTFLRLPPTDDKGRLKATRRINFTLMERYGGMYACIVPPTSKSAGLAATYFPDPTGSQRAAVSSTMCEATKPPASWDKLVANGLSGDDHRVRATFAQACRLYPVLRDYAEISHTICRTVFNASVRGSKGGRDRRVRELSDRHHRLSADGLISGWTAPKWTNAELAALMAVNYVLTRSGGKPLPTNSVSGCGPTKLDVAQFVQLISCHHLKMSLREAQNWARLSQLPDRIVCKSTPQFQE